MPRYKCMHEGCNVERSYSLHELPALVRVKCPADDAHGRMEYLGPQPRPWYRGHAISSLLLLIGLFVALCALAEDLSDQTEITVLLTVGLACAAFEAGRIAPRQDEKRFGLNVSQIRIAGFFFVAILMMAWSQDKIDDGEVKTLLILGSLTIVWHLIVFFGEWYRHKEFLQDFGWDLVKQLCIGALGILFATQIKTVADALHTFRGAAESIMTRLGTIIQTVLC
ncbi:MAG: hypothetical protein KF847_17610 [Pirellulales bacterium]|nr:hypothetical protein [Pirellulales bacterium]